MTHLELFTGSRTQRGDLELHGFSVTLYSDSEVNKVQFGSETCSSGNEPSVTVDPDFKSAQSGVKQILKVRS